MVMEPTYTTIRKTYQKDGLQLLLQ